MQPNSMMSIGKSQSNMESIPTTDMGSPIEMCALQVLIMMGIPVYFNKDTFKLTSINVADKTTQLSPKSLSDLAGGVYKTSLLTELANFQQVSTNRKTISLPIDGLYIIGNNTSTMDKS